MTGNRQPDGRNRDSRDSDGRDGDGGLSRRGLLATTVTLATAGLAGCGGITDQEFTADPIGIPDDAQSELGYQEQQKDGETIERSRDVAGVEVTATIETYFATYTPDGYDESAAESELQEGDYDSEREARKQALIAGLESAGEEDILTMPSMAAVSTPKGEIAGQTLNPLANRDIEDLLTDDRATELLSGSGGSGEGGAPSELDWEREPEEIETEDTELVGEDGELKAMAGIAEDGDSLSFVLGALTRSVDENVVISAGLFALPAEDEDRDYVGEDGFLTEDELETVLEGAVASTEAVELE